MWGRERGVFKSDSRVGTRERRVNEWFKSEAAAVSKHSPHVTGSSFSLLLVHRQADGWRHVISCQASGMACHVRPVPG